MTRVPVLAIAVLLGCVGAVGYVYQQTRPKTDAAPPAAAAPVVKIDRVREAVAKTSAVKSFTFDFTIEYTAGPADSFTMTGDGSADLAHKLVSVTTRVPEAPPGSAASHPTTAVVDYSNGF